MPHQSLSFLNMFVLSLGLLLSLAPQLGFAQGKGSSASTTSNAPAATQTVNVGADGLKFTPPSVKAAIGDTVLFRFYPQNHSVARSDFKNPCIPYELTGVGRVGFYSGFKPINVVLSSPPTFSVVVNDTDPIWFYCSAPGACNHDLMVGVINPNSSETLEVQTEFAANSTLVLSPGEGFPVEGGPTTTKAAPSSSPTSGSSSSNPTASAAASSKPVLTGGEIAGIAIGGAAVLLLGSALLYFCGRQRTVGEILHRRQMSHGPPSYQPPSGHMSLASSPGYPSKYPQVGVDYLGPQRYSSQTMYARSAAETESYRSRSPPIDESRDPMIPPMNFGSPGTTSPARVTSPLMRRPVPDSPGRTVSNPISPLDEATYQPVSVEMPSNSKINPQPMEAIHELPTDNDRNYPTYQLRDPGRGNFGPPQHPLR